MRLQTDTRRGSVRAPPRSFIPSTLSSAEWLPFIRNKQYFGHMEHDNALFGANSGLRAGSAGSVLSAGSNSNSNSNEALASPVAVEPNTSWTASEHSSRQRMAAEVPNATKSQRPEGDLAEMGDTTRSTRLPPWVRDYSKIDCEFSVRRMDALWNASFKEFVRDERNVDCVGRHVAGIVRDMPIAQVANGLAWLIRDWGMDSTACLLRRVTHDWEPEHAALLVGQLTAGWSMGSPLCLFLALLLNGESAAIAGAFLHSLSGSWTSAMVTQAITYLDMVLEWSTEYFREMTAAYIELSCGSAPAAGQHLSHRSPSAAQSRTRVMSQEESLREERSDESDIDQPDLDSECKLDDEHDDQQSRTWGMMLDLLQANVSSMPIADSDAELRRSSVVRSSADPVAAAADSDNVAARRRIPSVDVTASPNPPIQAQDDEGAAGGRSACAHSNRRKGSSASCISIEGAFRGQC